MAGAQETVKVGPTRLDPCARITTRVLGPASGKVQTVPHVLVQVLLPIAAPQRREEEDVAMSEEDSSWSDESTDQEFQSSSSGGMGERAYWLQRTLRDAIYGSVKMALVLKKSNKEKKNARASTCGGKTNGMDAHSSTTRQIN